MSDAAKEKFIEMPIKGTIDVVNGLSEGYLRPLFSGA